MGIGLPGFIEHVFTDAVHNVMSVFAAAGAVFAEHSGPAPSPVSHTDQVLWPDGAPPATPPGGTGAPVIQDSATAGSQNPVQRSRMLATLTLAPFRVNSVAIIDSGAIIGYGD